MSDFTPLVDGPTPVPPPVREVSDSSPAIGDLAAALATAQGAMRTAKENSDNPFFKSSYADLASIWAACREALTANGLAVIQLPSAEGAEVSVRTVLAHSSGQWIATTITMTAKDASPQAIGSAITYARRYGLAPLVGVAAGDDDDGEAAMGRQPPAAKPAAPKTPEPPALERVLDVTESEKQAGQFWIKTNGGVYVTGDAATADQLDQTRRDGVDVVIHGTPKTIGRKKVTEITRVEEVPV